jgi:hypothetical protein
MGGGGAWEEIGSDGSPVGRESVEGEAVDVSDFVEEAGCVGRAGGDDGVAGFRIIGMMRRIAVTMAMPRNIRFMITALVS